MEYPPVKPHHKAMHELHKLYIYEKYQDAFQHILGLAGDDRFAQLEVYYFYFETYRDMGKVEEAKEILLKAREIPTSDDNQFKILRSVIEAKYNINIIKDKEASAKHLDQALSLFKEHSGDLYFFVLNDILCRRGLVLKQFDEGIKLGREILENAPENLLEMRARAHTQLGEIYSHLGELDEADANFLAALKLFQRLGYAKYIAGMYGNLGTTAYSRFQSDKTKLEYLQEAIKDTHLMIDTLSTTSDVYFTVLGFAALGEFYADAKVFSRAIEYSAKALSITRAAPTSASISSVLLAHGEILFKAAQYEQSLSILEECTSYAHVLQGEMNVELYRLLCSVCNHLDLWEKGFTYSQKLVQVLQEYADKTKAGIQYHNKILAEKLSLENELHELQLRSVEEKMQTQASLLVAQTDLLDKFRNDLRAIVREIDEPIAALKRIKEKLKELPCAQIDWTKFEAQFNEVHPDFRSKLHQKYPELTEMEQRIAVMVRMDLKSADIAKLFCITERAVEFHRLNLRKKLKLEAGESLPKFLQGL